LVDPLPQRDQRVVDPDGKQHEHDDDGKNDPARGGHEGLLATRCRRKYGPAGGRTPVVRPADTSGDAPALTPSRRRGEGGMRGLRRCDTEGSYPLAPPSPPAGRGSPSLTKRAAQPSRFAVGLDSMIS